MRGGFGDLSDEWKKHLAMGELASRFRKAGRLLPGEDDTEDDDDDIDNITSAPSPAARSLEPLKQAAKDDVDTFRKAAEAILSEGSQTPAPPPIPTLPSSQDL